MKDYIAKTMIKLVSDIKVKTKICGFYMSFLRKKKK